MTLEETYRKVDPDGFLNMGYIDTESKEIKNGKHDFSSKETNGKNILDA